MFVYDLSIVNKQQDKTMGMIVSVYRDSSSKTDCTAGGVSSKFTRLCVVNVDGPFEPADDLPAAILVSGPYSTARIVPLKLHKSRTWVMYGGNIAVTSDSRFGEAVSKVTKRNFADGVVKIFDRVEDHNYGMSQS